MSEDRPAESMTVREVFAAAALQGIISSPTWNAMALDAIGANNERALRIAAGLARGYADALIEVLKEVKDEDRAVPGAE